MSPGCCSCSTAFDCFFETSCLPMATTCPKQSFYLKEYASILIVDAVSDAASGTNMFWHFEAFSLQSDRSIKARSMDCKVLSNYEDKDFYFRPLAVLRMLFKFDLCLAYLYQSSHLIKKFIQRYFSLYQADDGPNCSQSWQPYAIV